MVAQARDIDIKEINHQPIAGAISDRSSFRWGRRRPYILLGTILAMLLLPGIGFSS
ncbi:unnamed protein product, partial [marine sediment metagenome]